MHKNLIDEKQAAQILNVAVQTMRNRRMQGRPPKYVKLGRSIRYDVSDLDAYIEAQKVEARVNG